jgi:hypothetical protein
MELGAFNVVMDSNTYYGAGDGKQNRQYYFDWSVIPDGKYELTFSLVSDASTISTLLQYTLFSNMISPQNVYQAGDRVGANTIAYLGTLRFDSINNGTTPGTLNCLIANATDNQPVICNRPMTNIFTIGIFNGLSGVLVNPMPDYMLTLHFKPLRLGLA